MKVTQKKKYVHRVVSCLCDLEIVMKLAPKIEEKRDRCLRNKPLRGENSFTLHK